MTSTTTTTVASLRTRRLHRLLAVLGGGAAAVATWAVAVLLLGVELAVDPMSGKTSVDLPAVVFGSLVPGLCGWLLLAALERFTTRARRTWTLVAVIVLALSLATPIMFGQGGAAVATMLSLHLVTGAVVIPLLARSAGSPAPEAAGSPTLEAASSPAME